MKDKNSFSVLGHLKIRCLSDRIGFGLQLGFVFITKKVFIGKAVLVGAFSVVLPGSILNNFSSTAAYSVIYKTIKEGFYHSNLYKKISLKRRNLKQMKMMYSSVSKIKK